jgi:DNA-binding CsgD family transcriptional regulator
MLPAELFPSPRTLEWQLRKIFAKLGISSRTELVRMSRQEGAVDVAAGA